MLEKMKDLGLDIDKIIGIVFLVIIAIVLYTFRKFFKDSVRDLKHVVWPTREETKNYFITVVSVLVLFGLYLFIVSTIFTESLFGLKKIVKGESSEKVEKTATNNNLKVSPTIKVDSVKVEKKNVDEKSKVVPKVEAKVESTGTGTSK